jgi:catechol 2,3-dioxygenase-like lactoylglutathione lyase family enzyme
MTMPRMDNVGIMVDDLDAAIAFFKELGLELEGKASVEGPWVDRLLALDGVRCDIAMMQTADKNIRLELSQFRRPKAQKPDPEDAPVNTLGLHRIMFAVDDIADVLARLKPHGGKLLGEVTQYEDMYNLAYVRGPAGILIALAQELRGNVRPKLSR